VEHAGAGDVGDIASAADEQFSILTSLQRLAYPLRDWSVLWSLSCPRFGWRFYTGDIRRVKPFTVVSNLALTSRWVSRGLTNFRRIAAVPCCFPGRGRFPARVPCRFPGRRGVGFRIGR
jgi:hypothetical protein